MRKKLFSLLALSTCLTSTYPCLSKDYQEPLITRIEQGTYNACTNLHSKFKTIQKKLAPYGPYAYKAVMFALPPVAYCAATKAYLDYHTITDDSLGYFDRTSNKFIYYEPYPRSNHILNNKAVALPVIGLLGKSVV